MDAAVTFIQDAQTHRCVFQFMCAELCELWFCPSNFVFLTRFPVWPGAAAGLLRARGAALRAFHVLQMNMQHGNVVHALWYLLPPRSGFASLGAGAVSLGALVASCSFGAYHVYRRVGAR